MKTEDATTPLAENWVRKTFHHPKDMETWISGGVTQSGPVTITVAARFI